MLVGFLRKEHFEVSMARSGKEGLKKAGGGAAVETVGLGRGHDFKE